MDILFLLAQSEKSAGTVIRGIAGMLIIPLVIVIIVVLTSKASKKKNKKIGDKFLEGKQVFDSEIKSALRAYSGK